VNDGLPLDHMGKPCFFVASLIFFACGKSGIIIATEMHAHYGHNQIAMVYRHITAYKPYVESSVQYDLESVPNDLPSSYLQIGSRKT
jgi:hypothetical protein